jgi:phenylalanine-4-hydroxylase
MTFTNEEHGVWGDLIKQQLLAVRNVACPEFLTGLELLNFSIDKIPAVEEVSEKLNNLTGWSLICVNDLVDNKVFLSMLGNRQFPVINVIRPREEINFYTNEAPDIFHEFFGHCPLLTNKNYADHMCKFGQYASGANDEWISKLSDIYWATFEFGLIKNDLGVKVFGAGILPSKNEMERIFSDKKVEILPLNIFSKIDASLQGNIMQPIYYTINSLEVLYSIIDNDVNQLMSMKKVAA